eukprot:m.65069 g.65069  ORF g.65069 m.65069 type:complete len:919 (+) comp15908_c0_seq5:148-2904(+)
MSKISYPDRRCSTHLLLVTIGVIFFGNAVIADVNTDVSYAAESTAVNISGSVELYIEDGFADGSLPSNDYYPAAPRIHRHFAVLVSETHGDVALNLDARWANVQHGDIVNASVQLQPSDPDDSTAQNVNDGVEHRVSEVFNVEVVGHVDRTPHGLQRQQRRASRQAELLRRRRELRRSMTMPDVTTDFHSVLFVSVAFDIGNATSDTYCNETCIRKNMWSNRPTFVRQLMVESSYNALDFREEDSEFLSITLAGNASTTPCSMRNLTNNALVVMQAMRPADTAWWTSFDHVVFYIPRQISGCSWAGLGQIGCRVSCRLWMRSSGSGTLAHELMHNLGMNHASTDRNNDNVIDQEYGDRSDIVGGASALTNSNAPHREQLGWLPLARVRDLNAEGLPVDTRQYCVVRDGVHVRQATSRDYRGTVNVTRSGKPCQMWTAQTPQSHSMLDRGVDSLGLGDHNYCRNPDGEDSIWCYTTVPGTRWERCDDGCSDSNETLVPTAAPTTPPPTPAVCNHTWNITLASLGHMPDNTYGDSAVRFKRSTGGYYYISLRTAKGPHERGMTSFLVDRVFIHYQLSRRGNTNLVVWLEEGESWIETHMGFTVTFTHLDCPNRDNATISIDFCNPGVDGVADLQPETTEYCAQSQGYFQSTVNHTACGVPCLNWDANSEVHGTSPDHNYCRHVGKDYAWCNTASGVGICDVCGNTTNCTYSHERQCSCSDADPTDYYLGPINQTIDGIACQAWDSQFPHTHTRTPSRYPSKNLTGNMCRNPDGESCTWCYTVDPSVRWDCCDLCPYAAPIAYVEEWLAEVDATEAPTATPTDTPTGEPTTTTPTSVPTATPTGTPTPGQSGAQDQGSQGSTGNAGSSSVGVIVGVVVAVLALLLVGLVYLRFRAKDNKVQLPKAMPPITFNEVYDTELPV